VRSARAALVYQDDIAIALNAGESRGGSRIELRRGLSRPSGEDE